MKATKYLLSAALMMPLGMTDARAQGNSATVVTTCGMQSIPLAQGTSGNFIDATGKLCTSAAGSSTVTANQGTPNAGGAQAWPVIDNNSAALLAAVQSAIPAGTNLIGSVQAVPGTTLGLSFATKTAANSDNCTNLKASAGNLYHVTGYSAAAVPTWVSFYNTAGTPTGGTGIVYQMLIPVNSTSGGGAVDDIPSGLSFSTGIGYCITTGIAGTGSVAATSIVVNFGYK